MKKKKVLITGAKGQLGSAIGEVSKKYDSLECCFTDLDELDITNAGALDAFMERLRPDILINCAAYTAVDKAEEEKDKAFLINSHACGNLAQMSLKYGCKLLHISTDFVFDGRQNTPLHENDPTGPLSVYGASKLEGEKRILSACPDALIIRTSWLYYQQGHNFVRTMQRYGRERAELSVVYDQLGSPTYAGDLAQAVLQIISAFPDAKGIYHYANEGVISWFDFAKTIMELSEIKCQLHPVLTSQYPTAAKRPAYSVLDKAKFRESFGIAIPWWKDSLRICIEKMK